VKNLLRPTGRLTEVFVPELKIPGDDALPPPPPAMPTDAVITWRNRLDHWLARWGYRRGQHRVAPGLYALGQPTPDSAVFVTANYTLSFDALRAALAGHDAYILVLDTHGINVWCAAGKGTFGTDELVRRIDAAGLHRVVRHRRLILPQLGASGVAAHLVKQRTGFRVRYGPVRADDLPAYLATGEATAAMRRVTFTFRERLVLVPVELVHTILPMLGGALALWLLVGPWAALGALAAVLSGAALFPLLLPWLPGHDFSLKGYVLGAVAAAVPAVWGTLHVGAGAPWIVILRAVGLALGLPTVTAFLALNFTGATPLTSPSWVRREMRRYIPLMIAAAALGVLLIVAAALGTWLGR
jgi:hypothetical protein